MEIQNYNTSGFRIDEVQDDEERDNKKIASNNYDAVKNYKIKNVELRNRYSAMSKDGDTVLFSKKKSK